MVLFLQGVKTKQNEKKSVLLSGLLFFRVLGKTFVELIKTLILLNFIFTLKKGTVGEKEGFLNL